MEIRGENKSDFLFPGHRGEQTQEDSWGRCEDSGGRDGGGGGQDITSTSWRVKHSLKPLSRAWPTTPFTQNATRKTNITLSTQFVLYQPPLPPAPRSTPSPPRPVSAHLTGASASSRARGRGQRDPRPRGGAEGQAEGGGAALP